MTEPTFWSALTLWWKEATTLIIAVAGLFGIRYRGQKGNNLPTKTEFELLLSTHEKKLMTKIDELKTHFDSQIRGAYKEARRLDERTNDRINNIHKQ